MSGLKQGIDVWQEVADRLPELQDLDVSEMADFRGGYLENKILGNSDVEADYSTLTLYRCMLLSPIKNALSIGTFDYANTSAILCIPSDLSLSNVHIQGIGTELRNKSKFRIQIVNSLFENCTFKTCYMRDCDFSGSRFVNVKFLGGGLYNCNFEGCSFHGCTFDSAYDGDDWIENLELDGDCNFKRTRFVDCFAYWFIYVDDEEEVDETFKDSNIRTPDLPSIEFN